MAKTLQNVITEVRQVLQDEDSDNYRYPDADLVGYLNNAFYEIRRLRPDAYINTFRTALPHYTTSDLATEFPLDLTFFQATVYFVAGNAELRDDEFTVDARAVTFLTQFKTMLREG